MSKNKLLATTLAVALTATCVFAAQGNVSATPSGTVQDGPTISSTGKIESGDGSVSIDAKDLTNISDIMTNNAEILRMTQEVANLNSENIGSDSDAYDSSKTYKVGDLCFYDDVVYKCIADINSAEEWNSAHWEKASLSGSINSLNDSLNSISTNLGNGRVEIVVNDDNTIGYKLDGADTVNPFKSNLDVQLLAYGSSNGTYRNVFATYDFNTDYLNGSITSSSASLTFIKDCNGYITGMNPKSHNLYSLGSGVAGDVYADTVYKFVAKAGNYVSFSPSAHTSFKIIGG